MWKDHWNLLPQPQIRIWIKGILHNIRKIIELNGGNDYKEGREAKRSYVGRQKGAFLPRIYTTLARAVVNK